MKISVLLIPTTDGFRQRRFAQSLRLMGGVEFEIIKGDETNCTKELTEARGDWLWFAREDDCFSPAFLPSLIALGENSGADMAVCKAQPTGGDTPLEMIPVPLALFPEFVMAAEEYTEKYRDSLMHTAFGNKIFSRRLFEKVRGDCTGKELYNKAKDSAPCHAEGEKTDENGPLSGYDILSRLADRLSAAREKVAVSLSPMFFVTEKEDRAEE